MGTGTILYVHGAGNREEAAKGYEAALRRGFKLGPDAPALRRSAWGDRSGPPASLPGLDDVLPPAETVDAGFAAVPDLADPLAPLRALAVAPGEAAFAADSPDADRLLGALAAGLVDLSDLGITAETLQASAQDVANSPEYAAARGTEARKFDAALQSAVATAIAKDAPAGFGVGNVTRAIEKAAGRIAQSLLGSGVLSVAGSWIGTNLGPPAKLALSRRLANERSTFMHANILVAADVLFYQRSGARIRNEVREELAALERPIVALGHSLGGIILVDTLFGPDATASGVELLVTFGSQSAFLQSIGALDVLTPNLPWMNIWTRFDFASFLAGRLWPGRVRDVEVPIEVGFPDAHGAYFEEPGFFEVLLAEPSVQGILS